MNKGAIFLTLLLVSSIAGTYAVYEFYVKQRLIELGDHREEAKQLRTKITQLDETFYGTKPDTVLSIWRTEIQPWADAVDRRTTFYDLGGVPLEVEIPEEERDLPKFFYKREHPKLVRAIENSMLESGVRLPDPGFGTPDPASYGPGSNPSVEEISGHLARFEFGKAVADLLIGSGAKSITELVIWPEQNAIKGQRGVVEYRTTGLAFTIPMRNWVVLMDELSQEDRYIEVKALRITNRTLREPYADMSVDMVLAQAYYKRDEQVREVGGEMGSSKDRADMLATLIPGRGPGGGPGGLGRPGGMGFRGGPGPGPGTPQKMGWWKSFRRKYLPF